MGRTWHWLSLLLLGLLVAACAPQGVPEAAPVRTPPPAPVPVAAPAPAAPARASWQVEWEKSVEAAQKEGVLALGTSAGNEVQRELSQAFKGKYGIRVETVGGTAGVIMSRIQAERRAGLYLWDVLVSGGTALVSTWKPAGGTSPLEPVLILPDFTDSEVIKKTWYQGRLWWLDRDKHVMAGLVYIESHMGINTNLVKPGEIKSWDEVLNPKWKGKMMLFDPTQPGTHSDGGMMLMLYENKGEAWVRRLAAQEPVIMRDDRLAHDWLAHGKYPLYLAPRAEMLAEFVKSGAPVAPVLPDDLISLATGSTAVGLVDKSPHPNAGKVFINWYLRQEGQTIMSRTRLNQSARLDVPTDFLPQDAVRKPGVNYWWKMEEVILKVVDRRNTSKEIFGPLLK